MVGFDARRPPRGIASFRTVSQIPAKTMPEWIRWIAIRWSAFLERLMVRHRAGGIFFGPLMIDRGRDPWREKFEGGDTL
jgi:hypothetical protein